MIPTAMILSC